MGIILPILGGAAPVHLGSDILQVADKKRRASKQRSDRNLNRAPSESNSNDARHSKDRKVV